MDESIKALSPLDGRYAHTLDSLRPYLSEYALIYYRLFVEIRWLEILANEPHMTELPRFTPAGTEHLNALLNSFNVDTAKKIKAIEATTNHDMKAVEYLLKEHLALHSDCQHAVEFVHFACTSEDINNLAYGLMLKEALHQVILPEMRSLIRELKGKASDYAEQPMLSRTHGQPASPTTVGKELSVFVFRLHRQYNALQQSEILGKINGAVGNFNAHCIAYPDVNWLYISQQFVESLDLVWNPYTTQIESHDSMIELFNTITLFNQILIDLSRDLWGYISLEYFKQRVIVGEIGSSTMPHKVNPINFENAEGNLGIANAIFQHFARQLPTSRWQRDLVDSTTLRNISTAFGHSLLGYQQCLKGLQKCELNPIAIDIDLSNHYEVLAEAVQTVMRRYGILNPYEQLKQLTRGKPINQSILAEFIQASSLPVEVKLRLIELKPQNYLGLAADLAKRVPSVL